MKNVKQSLLIISAFVLLFYGLHLLERTQVDRVYAASPLIEEMANVSEQTLANSDEDLEEFRRQLFDFYTELSNINEKIVSASMVNPAEHTMGVQGFLVKTQQKIPELTQEDLKILREAIANNPAWWEIPQILQSALKVKAAPVNISSRQPDCGADPLEDWHVAKQAEHLAKLTMELLPTDGFTISARTVATGAHYGAQVTATFLDRNRVLYNSCTQRRNQSSLTRLHLGIIALEGDRKYLVSVTEAGMPINVKFVGVQASHKTPISFTDVVPNTTIVMVEPGIYEVTLDLPASLEDAELFTLQVQHEDINDRFGYVMFPHKRGVAGAIFLPVIITNSTTEYLNQ